MVVTAARPLGANVVRPEPFKKRSPIVRSDGQLVTSHENKRGVAAANESPIVSSCGRLAMRTRCSAPESCNKPFPIEASCGRFMSRTSTSWAVFDKHPSPMLRREAMSTKSKLDKPQPARKKSSMCWTFAKPSHKSTHRRLQQDIRKPFPIRCNADSPEVEKTSIPLCTRKLEPIDTTWPNPLKSTCFNCGQPLQNEWPMR
mmetsp:Transcript_27894/g.86469  ORF Transcript_27894/g.86469 Transcript_27894/m.86469 type:complete len:201 (-) Transcript_27894:422-1024(-)